MLELSAIRTDGGTQARVAMNAQAVAEYRDAFRAGVDLPPVIVFYDDAAHWLADGFHRYHGAKAAGMKSISANIMPGSRRDAVLYSLKANATHGLRRTNADKRKAIETMLGDPEWSQWSDSRIAGACGVSDKTVASVRAIFGNSEDAKPAVRTVQRGGATYTQRIGSIGKVRPIASATSTGDNAAFRALFSLPPIQPATSTELAVPVVPSEPEHVTGDFEVDAVLWLQGMVRTGDQALIGRALEAAKRINTPMKELQKRYEGHIMRTGGHVLQAMLATLNFGDLNRIAKTAVAKAQRRHEALSRFGSMEAVYAYTPAEEACMMALDGLKPDAGRGWIDVDRAAPRFAAHPDLVPATLTDCLVEFDYWHALYSLRAAFEGGFGDCDPAGSTHEDYAFAALARIPPRDTAEAMAVLDRLLENDRMGRAEVPAILRNLIAGPRGRDRAGDRDSLPPSAAPAHCNGACCLRSLPRDHEPDQSLHAHSAAGHRRSGAACKCHRSHA
ncbi:ParB/RepB/Spo0J family partition protein [Xenophilus azovorans]|uniref:ParB/RepB/Spo0J family partition protein n=1 Tax=Xenophilus azovorans TaxID=151755 RepID=UPI000689A872|nr:ParB/RepB/Spo0J family partition protein [Xenophilus azovorans]